MNDKTKKFLNHRSIPDTFRNLELWRTRRREILKAAVLGGIASQLFYLESCSDQDEEANEILSAKQVNILKSVLEILFPSDGNGPGASEINAFEYVMWVLRDTLNRKLEDNDFIVDGIDWADDTSNEIYFCPYQELEQDQKEALVDLFTRLDWGRTWCSAMIDLIFEALLMDPIYGGNTDECGWKWLGHKAGFPRPVEENRYERIMEKQRNLI